MGLPKVNSFLCFTLETGGKIVAWFNIVFSAIILGIFLFVAFTALVIASCDEIVHNSKIKEQGFDVTYENCQLMKIVLLLILMLILAPLIINIVVFSLLIKGIENRRPGYLIPALVILGVGILGLIANALFTLNSKSFINLIVSGALSVYIFIVIYSLYVKIRDGAPTQYMAPVQYAASPVQYAVQGQNVPQGQFVLQGQFVPQGGQYPPQGQFVPQGGQYPPQGQYAPAPQYPGYPSLQYSQVDEKDQVKKG